MVFVTLKSNETEERRPLPHRAKLRIDCARDHVEQQSIGLRQMDPKDQNSASNRGYRESMTGKPSAENVDVDCK